MCREERPLVMIYRKACIDDLVNLLKYDKFLEKRFSDINFRILEE